MRNARRLGLKREALAPLTTEDMTAVVGGSHACALTDACTDTLTHGPSIDASCPSPTLPVRDCIDPLLAKLSAAICP